MSIATAPRDGTIIEIKNTYGVAPSYALFRWSGEIAWPDGRTTTTSPYWQSVKDCRSGLDGEGPWATWRPFIGDPSMYVDPTNGAQHTSEYWRGATAAKHGLPLDAFERIAAENARRNSR